ncbi:hypothetical protein [Thermomonospora umbrina]|nr:hypothetical protein [Thermomonospora umbrina]
MQFDSVHETLHEAAPSPSARYPRSSSGRAPRRRCWTPSEPTLTSVSTYVARRAEAERPDEIVVVIQTDGKENASKEWQRSTVRDAIEQHRGDGWQILFLGADQDAEAAAAELGVSAETSLSYSSHNTIETMTSVGIALTRGTRTGHYGLTTDERRDATS